MERIEAPVESQDKGFQGAKKCQAEREPEKVKSPHFMRLTNVAKPHLH